MEVTNQPKLMFHGVDFVNIKFDTYIQYDNNAGIDLNVEPKVFYPKDNEKIFKIIMDISLHCEKFFDLNLVGIGIFEFDSKFKDEGLKKNFVNANAPAIMFPYIRAFVTILTSNIGNVTGTLTIPTQFFQGDLPEISTEDIEA
ncbi:MAG: protein-export chaperone SecB [Bacteroidales bacterium]|nr:protein-export chaperone SecB [Bacteroidales bacterium]